MIYFSRYFLDILPLLIDFVASQKKLYGCENCFHFVKLLSIGNGQVIVYHHVYINISIGFYC